MGFSQPSFNFWLKGRPSKSGATLTKKEAELAKELLKNFNTDYSIQIYFKDTPVGHGSRYSMSELAHHLMVEGQYSKKYEAAFTHKRGRRPDRMLVDRDKNGNAIRDANGKYILSNVEMYKKVWNFVDDAAHLHGNWKRFLMTMTDKIVRQAIARRNYLRRHGGHNVPLVALSNYYREMQDLGRRIVADCKMALLALEVPPLDENTIKKKKGHDEILIESRKLYNSIAYKVVKVEPKKSNRTPIYFGSLASYSTGKDKKGNAYFTGSNKEAIAQGEQEYITERFVSDWYDKHKDSSWESDGGFGGDK